MNSLLWAFIAIPLLATYQAKPWPSCFMAYRVTYYHRNRPINTAQGDPTHVRIQCDYRHAKIEIGAWFSYEDCVGSPLSEDAGRMFIRGAGTKNVEQAHVKRNSNDSTHYRLFLSKNGQTQAVYDLRAVPCIPNKNE